MACKESWITKYYDEPLKEYENQPKKNDKSEHYSGYNIYSQKKCTCCACSCYCCCNYDCDSCCESFCFCCPDSCNCYHFREFLGGVFACIIIFCFIIIIIGYIMSLFPQN